MDIKHHEGEERDGESVRETEKMGAEEWVQRWVSWDKDKVRDLEVWG